MRVLSLYIQTFKCTKVHSKDTKKDTNVLSVMSSSAHNYAVDNTVKVKER